MIGCNGGLGDELTIGAVSSRTRFHVAPAGIVTEKLTGVPGTALAPASPA